MFPAVLSLDALWLLIYLLICLYISSSHQHISMLGGRHRRHLGVRWRRTRGVSTFVRIQIKENPAPFHPHIVLSFKLQPIKTPIQYSYGLIKKKKIIMKVRGGRKCVHFTQSCENPSRAVLCWSCCWGAVTHLATLHTSVSPPPPQYLSIWHTVCLWGRKTLLSPLRSKRVSDLLKVTWEICKKHGIKPKALQSYFISDCILVQCSTKHKWVNSTLTYTISGLQWKVV